MFSLLGNVLVCISVYRNIRLRTSTNLYIVALAISDFLSTIFVMPLAAGVLISGTWPFGGTVCQMHAFMAQFVIYISPVTMGLRAINRYVRICNSDQQFKRFFSHRKSLILVVYAWVFVACCLSIVRLTGEVFCILFGLLFWVSIITANTKQSSKKHLHRRKSYNSVLTFNPGPVSVNRLPNNTALFLTS